MNYRVVKTDLTDSTGLWELLKGKTIEEVKKKDYEAIEIKLSNGQILHVRASCIGEISCKLFEKIPPTGNFAFTYYGEYYPEIDKTLPKYFNRFFDEFVTNIENYTRNVAHCTPEDWEKIKAEIMGCVELLRQQENKPWPFFILQWDELNNNKMSNSTQGRIQTLKAGWLSCDVFWSRTSGLYRTEIVFRIYPTPD